MPSKALKVPLLPIFTAPANPKPGYRLLGAIVEGPEGAVFFKLTGPEKSVTAAEKTFRKMLEGYPAAADKLRVSMAERLHIWSKELAGVKRALEKGQKK